MRYQFGPETYLEHLDHGGWVVSSPRAHRRYPEGDFDVAMAELSLAHLDSLNDAGRKLFYRGYWQGRADGIAVARDDGEGSLTLHDPDAF